MRLRDTLRQTPVLTLFAIVVFVGLIGYAVLKGTSGSASPTVTIAPGTPLGPTVIFTAPVDGASVTNPVLAQIAIGGIRFQEAGEPVKAGYGHLGIVIDGDAPGRWRYVHGRPHAPRPQRRLAHHHDANAFARSAHPDGDLYERH